MRTSTTRFLAGFIVAGAIGFGVVGAHAVGLNGPDAGIGIAGYNSQYSYSADGTGPGARSYASPEQYHQYPNGTYDPHYNHQ
jgi:hypothetical protein